MGVKKTPLFGIKWITSLSSSPKIKMAKVAWLFHNLPTLLIDASRPQNKDFAALLYHRAPPNIERCLKRAFAYAQLDIKEEEHWQILTAMMAIALFAKEPGRSKEWTKKRYLCLLTDVNVLRDQNKEGLRSEEAICKLLVKNKLGPYGAMTFSNLRRRLQEAKKIKTATKK